MKQGKRAGFVHFFVHQRLYPQAEVRELGRILTGGFERDFVEQSAFRYNRKVVYRVVAQMIAGKGGKRVTGTFRHAEPGRNHRIVYGTFPAGKPPGAGNLAGELRVMRYHIERAVAEQRFKQGADIFLRQAARIPCRGRRPMRDQRYIDGLANLYGK